MPSLLRIISTRMLNKLGSSLILLLGVTFLVFMLMKLQSVNPYLALIDPSASSENVEQQLHQLGYYDPIWQQFLKWLWRILQGDLGYSVRHKLPVSQMIRERLLHTLILSGVVFIISSVLSILSGIVMAAKAGHCVERFLNFFSFLGISIPSFFFALILIRFFSYSLGWFPASGIRSADIHASGWPAIMDILKHLVLPATVLILTQSAILIHYTKATMSMALKQEYILMARAKGLGYWRTIFTHGLRSVWPVLITVLALQLPALLSGTVIIEIIFVWPGVGELAYQAILHNDYPLVMGITVFSSIVIITMNLFADLLCQLIDPRIRRSAM